ncbi:hypothetical protein GCM10009550_76540 [Actinocorallia libanotica]|uniref:Uncharacterized protein n=1 Tax=Actinocorallia libanotica TaxID=46162 RepID=A0ABN1S1U1_9ACTN
MVGSKGGANTVKGAKLGFSEPLFHRARLKDIPEGSVPDSGSANPVNQTAREQATTAPPNQSA